MNIEKIKENLKNIYEEIIYFEEVNSTQTYIKQKYKENILLKETIVIANVQTDGKGTHGRIWESEKGKNILLTIALFPNCKIEKLKNLTITIAENIIEVIDNLYKIKLEIKAPNDIILNGKKLGGILTETIIQNENVKCLFIGIGINVNGENFSKDISKTATSLKKEFNKEFSRENIIIEIAKKLYKY